MDTTTTQPFYCPECDQVQPHQVTDEGLEEIYTCTACGNQQYYTVR